MTETEKPKKIKRFYGRKQSRPLRAKRLAAHTALMPALGIAQDTLTEQANITPDSLFDTPYASYRMEIGFGNGEHLTAQLKQFSDVGFFGIEPYIDGMGAFLKDCHEQSPAPQNIRVFDEDALFLVNSLTDNCLDKLYVLNPDPWPKTRHHKRRIIKQKNLTAFARVLQTGGQLIMATDVDDLAEWMMTHAMNHDAFKWTGKSKDDWLTPPSEWIETRFAFKGRSAGRQQTFLVFEKV